MVILPTVVRVAALDPDRAAKVAHPRIFTCNKPPGRRRNQGERPENRFSDSFERNKISPIHMKRGNEVRLQVAEWDQMVVAIASPKFMSVNSSMATMPVASSDRPTQTPIPSKASSAKIRKLTAIICSMEAADAIFTGKAPVRRCGRQASVPVTAHV